MRIFCIGLLLSFVSIGGTSQVKYFQGYIIYNYKEFDSKGSKVASPISREQLFIKDNIILSKTLSGFILSRFGDIQVYVDTELKARYSIDHSQKVIRNLGADLNTENILPLEEKHQGEENIVGHLCDIHFLKYIHTFESSYGVTRDTLRCTFYTSKEYKMLHPEVYGFLLGNRNSKVLDGRYEGVTLKVVIERSDNSRIVIESEEIKETNVDEFVKLPSYPIVK